MLHHNISKFTRDKAREAPPTHRVQITCRSLLFITSALTCLTYRERSRGARFFIPRSALGIFSGQIEKGMQELIVFRRGDAPPKFNSNRARRGPTAHVRGPVARAESDVLGLARFQFRTKTHRLPRADAQTNLRSRLSPSLLQPISLAFSFMFYFSFLALPFLRTRSAAKRSKRGGEAKPSSVRSDPALFPTGPPAFVGR